MSTAADFDLGPLTWVKSEIDQALEKSLASLRTYAANPGDSNQIRFSQTHFHQAHGALQIVGLDGVTRLSEELDGLLGDIAKAGGAPKPEAARRRGARVRRHHGVSRPAARRRAQPAAAALRRLRRRR